MSEIIKLGEKEYNKEELCYNYVYYPPCSDSMETTNGMREFSEEESLAIKKKVAELGCKERGYITDEELEIIGCSRENFCNNMLWLTVSEEPVICSGALEALRKWHKDT